MALLLPQEVEKYIASAEAELGPMCGDSFAVVIADHLRQWVKENNIEIDFKYEVTAKAEMGKVPAACCFGEHYFLIRRDPPLGLRKVCASCGVVIRLTPEEEKGLETEFLAQEQVPGALPSGYVPGVGWPVDLPAQKGGAAGPDK